MNCDECDSKRIISINAKCNDLCFTTFDNVELDGYVPSDIGIGGGDYIEIDYCMDCGKLQGKFPLPSADIEKNISDDELKDFYQKYFSPGMDVSIPNNLMWSILKDSERYGNRFRNYMEWFFNENNYCGNITIDAPCHMPSCEKFMKMYRNNMAELDE